MGDEGPIANVQEIRHHWPHLGLVRHIALAPLRRTHLPVIFQDINMTLRRRRDRTTSRKTYQLSDSNLYISSHISGPLRNGSSGCTNGETIGPCREYKPVLENGGRGGSGRTVEGT